MLEFACVVCVWELCSNYLLSDPSPLKLNSKPVFSSSFTQLFLHSTCVDDKIDEEDTQDNHGRNRNPTTPEGFLPTYTRSIRVPAWYFPVVPSCKYIISSHLF
jgi:hypothetical protein